MSTKHDRPNGGPDKRPHGRNEIRDYRRQDERPVERTQERCPKDRGKRRRREDRDNDA